MSARWFSIATALLLTLMGVVQLTSVRTENSTADEGVHLVAGYIDLHDHAFSIISEPPLAKMLCALPLLALEPTIPANYRQLEGNQSELSRLFLYENRLPADLLLSCARTVAVGLSILLGLAIALYTRKHYGPGTALLALTLYCFDPNVIANGRYVTQDIPAALMLFLTCIAWENYLERPRRLGLICVGVCLGLAMLTKYSLLSLPLIMLLMGIIAWRKRAAALVGPYLAAMILAGVVVFAGYAGEISYPYSDPTVGPFFEKTELELRANPKIRPELIPILTRTTTEGRALYWIARNVPIPAYSFWKGLRKMATYNDLGHDSYLMGRYSKTGWWYYFPVAFLVKTPLATLAMLFAAAGIAIWRKPQGIRMGLVIPLVVYLCFCLNSNIDIGLRHLLPAYPFLFVLCAAVLSSYRPGRVIASVLIPLLVIESASAYPGYLAFFNRAVGGTVNGPRYLLDSNIDWGQDLLKLKRYMNDQGLHSICLSYFGSGDPDYYGLNAKPLSFPAAPDCSVAAASVNELYDEDSGIKALLRCEPRARIGGSIYVYDLANGYCRTR
jgi:hypothetical protein